MSSSVRGKLLVAQPTMGDPNFDQTVTLLIEHNDDGALGVVLNRPLDLGVGSVLDDWADVPELATPATVFSGGPVGHGSALALARAGTAGDAEPGDAYAEVIDGLGVIDLSVGYHEASTGVDRVRIYSGYAGWGGGQLESELHADAWFVLDADPDDPFHPDPTALWPTVLARQGGDLARLAHYPRQLWLN